MGGKGCAGVGGERGGARWRVGGVKAGGSGGDLVVY